MTEKSRVKRLVKVASRWVGLLWLLAACSGPSNSVLPADQGSDQGNVAETSEPEDRVEVEEAVESRAGDLRPDGDGLQIEVTRVSDGDSVRATSSEGDLEIRLIGINAPEQDECFGPEAGEQLEGLLSAGEVTLHPWPAELDDFGRELGFLVSDGVFVNLSLIETGHVLSRAQSAHEFRDAFDEAESSASGSASGLWAPDACGVPVDGDLVITEVFENAPGDDRENPNGEFVIIENVGETVVPMQSWGLRDESTRHRYSFPDLELNPGERVRIRTGCGSDDRGADPIELFWCDPEPPVWNNDGDLALLLDPNGAIISEFVVTG